MKKQLRFIISFLLLFTIVYGFNLAFIGVTAPGGIYLPWLQDHLNYIEHWRNFNIQATAFTLDALGYPVKITSFTLAVPGRGGFKLIYSCLGYGIMSFLFSYVMIFPKPWRSRIVVLVPGLLIIQILNLIRFLIISLYWRKMSFYTWIDHHLAFDIFIYLVVIMILYMWINSNTKRCSIQA